MQELDAYSFWPPWHLSQSDMDYKQRLCSFESSRLDSERHANKMWGMKNYYKEELDFININNGQRNLVSLFPKYANSGSMKNTRSYCTACIFASLLLSYSLRSHGQVRVRASRLHTELDWRMTRIPKAFKHRWEIYWLTMLMEIRERSAKYILMQEFCSILQAISSGISIILLN